MSFHLRYQLWQIVQALCVSTLAQFWRTHSAPTSFLNSPHSNLIQISRRVLQQLLPLTQYPAKIITTLLIGSIPVVHFGASTRTMFPGGRFNHSFKADSFSAP